MGRPYVDDISSIFDHCFHGITFLQYDQFIKFICRVWCPCVWDGYRQVIGTGARIFLQLPDQIRFCSGKTTPWSIVLICTDICERRGREAASSIVWRKIKRVPEIELSFPGVVCGRPFYQETHNGWQICSSDPCYCADERRVFIMIPSLIPIGTVTISGSELSSQSVFWRSRSVKPSTSVFQWKSVIVLWNN